MSVFDTATPVPNETETNTEDTTVYLDELVGEGKKFKDVEALAKGKAEADKLIAELKAKEDEFAKNDYAKQLLEKMETQTTVPPVQTPEPNKGTDEGATTPASTEDIESLIAKAIAERETKSAVTANLETVNKTLESNFGTEAEAKVLAKANELGMTKERLQSIAADSPAAFLSLMGTKQPEPTVPLSSDRNTVNLVSNERDFNYYQKLRKENPKAFSTSTIQKQMVEDKNRLGNKFFS